MSLATWISLGTVALTILLQVVIVAIWTGGVRQQLTTLNARCAKLEADMGILADVKTAVAVLSTELKSARELQVRDAMDLKHDISNLKSGVQKLTDVLLEQRPRPA